MAQAYTAPDWSTGEGISPSNLQSISNVLEGIVQGSDRAIHNFSIDNSNIVVTYVDGTIETFAAVGIKGISNVTKTSSGGIDTYTFHYTDGTTYSFDVTNGASLEVIDNLESTSKTAALAAHQGKVLNGTINTMRGNITSIKSDVKNAVDTAYRAEMKVDELSDDVSGLNEDLTQTKADLKASSTMTSSEDLDYSINGNIVSADFVGYARKSKNLLDKNSAFSNIVDNDNTLWNKDIVLKPNTTYTVSTTLPRNNTSGANFFAYNSSDSASTSKNGLWNGQIRTLTTNADGIVKIAYRLVDFATKTKAYYLSFDFQIEEGTTSTDYEPYGIIKPSGVVESNGKNLFNKNTVVVGYLNANGTINIDGNYVTSDFIKVKPNATYYKGATSTPRNKYYDADKNPINTSAYNDIPNGTNATSFVIPSNVYYIRVSIRNQSGDTFVDNLQIEKGNVATPYYEYKGEPSTITLPYTPLGVGDIKDELIVYADGTGKFVKRVDSVDLGSFTWGKASGNYFYTYGIPNFKNQSDCVSSKYVLTRDWSLFSQNAGYLYTSDRVNINDNASTVEDFKALVNGVELIYQLATPTETPLTSAEVEQILALKTFADVTYIDADGMTYEIGYIINAGKAIKDLKDTLQTLINAIGGNA